MIGAGLDLCYWVVGGCDDWYSGSRCDASCGRILFAEQNLGRLHGVAHEGLSICAASGLRVADVARDGIGAPQPGSESAD